MALQWNTSDAIPRSLEDLASQFGTAGVGTTSGLEKRVEIDIEGTVAIAPEDLTPIAARIDCAVVEAHRDRDMLFAACDRCLFAVTPSKIVLTADSSVPVHKAVTALAALIAAKGRRVDWASFSRKNMVAPWAAPDGGLAAEYAELKQAFPAGHSFLFGPIDAEHSFMFVFDDAERARAMDIQVNIDMNDITYTPAVERLGLRPATKAGTVYQKCTAVGDGQYETIRLLTNDSGAHACMYESNARDGSGGVGGGTSYGAKIASLVQDFAPSSFSVTFLVDPACPDAENLDIGGIAFENYHRGVNLSNEFAAGYFITKTTFIRE